MAIEETTAQLLETLRGADLDAREVAAKKLQQIDDVFAVPAMSKALNFSGRARNEALRALARMGPKAAVAVPGLLALLAGDGCRQRVRDRAMRALVQIGEAAVPGLMGLLDDEDHYVQHRAAIALGDIGALEAREALLQRVVEVEPLRRLRVRRGLAYALHRIAPGEARQVVEALRSRLVAHDWVNRQEYHNTLYAVGETHPTPESMIAPVFITSVGYGALKAIQRQRRLEAVPALLEAGQANGAHYTRLLCFEVIAAMKAKEAVPGLCALLEEKPLQRFVLPTLGAIGELAAVPALRSFIRAQASTAEERQLGLEALGRIGGVEAARFLIAHLGVLGVKMNKKRSQGVANALQLLPKQSLRGEERFVLLRELLDLGCSAALWPAICAFLSRWPARDDKQIAVEYADAHCEAIPDKARVALLDRWDVQFSKQPDLSWGLVRHLLLEHKAGLWKLLLTRLHDQSLSQITHLSLPSFHLHGRLLKAMATSPHLSQLRVLDISANHLKEKGALILAGNPFFGQLERLVVKGCGFGREGKKMLQESPHLQDVEVVL